MRAVTSTLDFRSSLAHQLYCSSLAHQLYCSSLAHQLYRGGADIEVAHWGTLLQDAWTRLRRPRRWATVQQILRRSFP